jgi:HTH-type transcriptional repressor of NAD biosynthesis genes
MIRALVIGKFMPVHKGHLALIEFACSHSDELIVSLSFTPDDPIPGDLRFEWLKVAIAAQSKARAFMVRDDFDDESLPLEARTAHWSAFIQSAYPRIDVVVSSELYGEPFARHLMARHVLFDPDRKLVPVSATLIRSRPLTYWDFIVAPARPWFVRKVCIYGPESTGKSTVTRRLAERYHTSFVPEVAREMLISNDFTVDDIIAIGKAHDERIDQEVQRANRLLFCDTDVITTQLYSQHYLGVIPDILFALERKTSYALYFLLDVDVPWVADGLRDLGDRREDMMHQFRQALVERQIQFVTVKGDFDAREQIMVNAIDALLSGN